MKTNIKLLVLLSFLLTAFLICVLSCSDTSDVKNESGQYRYFEPTEDLIKNTQDPDRLTSYDMEIEIDYSASSFFGSSKVTYTNMEDRAIDKLYFRLFPNGERAYGKGELVVLSVYVDGKAIKTSSSLENTVIEIILDDLVVMGESIEIAFEFKGKLAEGLSEGGYGIYTKTEDSMVLSGWYPILAVYDDEGWNLDPTTAVGDSVYSDAAYYNVCITADQDMQLISTGEIIEESFINESKKCWYIKSGPSRDFVIVIGNRFEVISKRSGQVQVNAYYFPGNSVDAQKVLDKAVKSLDTFGELFGEYQFKELDIVETTMKSPMGVEYPELIIEDSRVYGDTIFTAHETAHQWWYNMVGNDVIDEPWLDEALTTYSSLIYLEYNEPQSYYNSVLEYFISEYEKYIADGKDDIVSFGLDHFEDLGQEHYSRIVYIKGAIFFHKLRNEIGDEAFFGALQQYFKDNKFKIASSEILLELFEKHSGRELDDIYEFWLFSRIDG